MYNKNRFLFDLQGTACKTTAFCLSPGQGRFDVLPATAFCCLVLDAFFYLVLSLWISACAPPGQNLLKQRRSRNEEYHGN